VRGRWPANRLERAVWATVSLAGCVAVGARWLERWRLPSPDRFAPSVFRVTNPADDGPGSLRQAILAADRAAGRARIVVAVPRIALEAVLPPLVNPSGVVIEAAPPGAEIDGGRVSGAVLDIASAGSLVSDLRIVGGGAGLVIRAPGAALHNVSLVEHDTGVLIGDGAGSVRIADSLFARNRVGVHLAAPAGTTTLQNTRFEDHRDAAIWAVNGATVPTETTRLDVVGNRFRNDTIGLVAINVIARVEGNTFHGQRSAAIHASGSRATINHNQILAGLGFGIYAERLQSGSISRNEIAHNCNGGILLRDVGNTEVVANDVYRNGYGVVLMEGSALGPNTVVNNTIADDIGDGILLIGSSPIVSHNRVLGNRRSWLRLSSLGLPSGETLMPTPLLTENIARNNGSNETERDQYAGETSTVSAAEDCSWRLDSPLRKAVQGLGER
jgi:hypothetical protein